MGSGRMKAILLAAGVGSRIAENIGNMPKSMMEVGGKPLIIHTVELLQKNHMEVVVITGFKHNMIEDALKDYSVKIYYNPFYAVTNSIGSLWYAREEFDTEEMLIANADVFYTQELLDRMAGAKYENFLLSDITRADNGDYYFMTENDKLVKYGKELLRTDRNAEYVGLAVLRNDWTKKFCDRLCEMIDNGDYDLWWENVLYSFVSKEDVHTYDVDGVFWSEIDTIEDYRRVVEYCNR